jgi:hypothetical protein
MANYDIYCEAMDIGFYYEITKLSARKVYKPLRYILSLSEAEKIYPKYETYEKIPINKDLIEDISTDKSEVIEEVDIVVEKLLKIASAKKWTKGAVTDYCLRNDVPRHRAELIINAIKGQALMDMGNNIKVEE